MQHEANDRLVPSEEAAKVLGLKNPETLAVWRSTKRYEIPYVKIGRSVRYRMSDLLAWVESRTQQAGVSK